MRKLLPEEIRRLKLALLDAFPTKAALEMLFQQELPGKTLDANALGNSLEDIVLNLIGKAQRDRWLMRLLDAAMKATLTPNPLLDAAAQEFKPLRALEEKDHFNVSFLSASMVLVNRTDLRDALQQLESTEPRGVRVLRVHGPAVSGQTYSKDLITYLYEARGSFEPIWIDLEDYITGMKPSDLAETIISKMGLREEELLPEAGPEQDARWVRTFCNRLIGKLRTSQTNWWIIIDGFNKIVVPDTVNVLIHALARTTMRDLRNLRIVLLSYKNELPDLAQYALEEKTKAISQEDLMSFFIQLYEESQQAFDPEKVAGNVADVWRKVDPADPRRIEKLGLEAARVGKSIIT